MKSPLSVLAGSILSSFALLYIAPSAAAAEHRASHVVIMVWDGMRPDMVTEKNTPTLYKLAHEGVTFAHNHPVYPTSTEVNGTAIATGVYPGTDHIIGNKEYRPDIDPRRAIPTEFPSAVKKGDKVTGGKYVAAPTLAEIIQKAGYPTVVAGTKGVVYLQDRSETKDTDAGKKSCLLFAGRTRPSSLLSDITKAEDGGFPPIITFPNTAQDQWTTQALVNVMWKTEIPKFSLLWVSDPDFSQHATAPGADTALAALKSSDDNLAAVLGTLEKQGVQDKTDVIVVSDHGFSTIKRSIDMAQLLKDAGFDAVRELSANPKAGQILVVGLGGSSEFYVVGHDAATTSKLVQFLQKSDFTGVIMTRAKLPGTFGLDVAHIDSPAAPDVVVAYRWYDEPNANGVKGLIDSDGGAIGKGMHASLSQYDLHNTLIANGPDFRKGYVDELPSGNVDVAPTVLHVLQIQQPVPMQGRVLEEALAETPGSSTPTATEKTISAEQDVSGGTWKQSLKISKVGSTVYLEEGEGTLEVKK